MRIAVRRLRIRSLRCAARNTGRRSRASTTCMAIAICSAAASRSARTRSATRTPRRPRNLRRRPDGLKPMRVLVLGAGVVGVAAAWYLAADGHEVVVVDREPGPALETSFANGGQISPSHAEPWANPEAPFQILRWVGREDAPLLFRLRADPWQWRFGVQFLLECLPWRGRRHTIHGLNPPP